MNVRAEHSTPTRIPARTWKIAAATGAGAFIAMLDSTVANLALESIRADLSAPLPLVQWVVSGYLVALAVSLPATGWLGRRYGYGRIWAAALAVFIASSLFCALAPGPSTLIAARLLQGLAAGVMLPAGQAVLGAAAGPNQLGRLMGSVGFVVSLGPAVGPAVGGLLLESASWRWLFGINVPIGIAALIAARGLVPAGATRGDQRLDWRGLALGGLGLPLLLYGATEIGSSGLALVSFLAVTSGAALTLAFILSGLRSDSPLLDLRLLRHGVFAAAATTTGLTGANMYAGLLLLPLYLQLAAHQGPVETGLMLLAMGLGSAVALYVGGRLIDSRGPGTVALAGAALLLVTTLPFLVADSFPAAGLALILVVRGAGLALAQMPAMTAAYTSVTAEEIGDATALVNITQRIGGAVGAVAVVVALAQSDGDTEADDYGWAFGALVVVSALTLITSAALRRGTSHSS